MYYSESVLVIKSYKYSFLKALFAFSYSFETTSSMYSHPDSWFIFASRPAFCTQYIVLSYP